MDLIVHTASVWAMKTYKYIRQLRKRAGLSQEQLAIRLQVLGLDVSQPWVSKLERGLIRITDENIPYIALALNVTPNELLRWEEFLRLHRS